MNRLEDKVVILVGGATGSGPGCALRIALEGADLIVADSDPDAAEAAAAKIRDAGGQASAETVDINEEQSVVALMDRVAEQHGRIDGLHTDTSSHRFAGRDTHIVDLDTEVWDDTLYGGLRSYLYTIKHAVPHMARGGGGSIVNSAAPTAWAAMPMNHAYAAAKAGVLSLTASVVASYGKHGIRCNAICTGFIVNEYTEDKFSDEFREMVLTHIPHTRLGNPDDIGRLSSFLLSEDSDYITGQVIGLDGGLGSPSSLYSDMPKPVLD